MTYPILLILLLSGTALAQPLPGTAPLTWEGDLSIRMMDGAHRFIERQIDRSLELRQRKWSRDFSSREAYEQSVSANRKRFLERIGAVDPLLPPSMERFGDDANPALVADLPAYRIYQVRWPVLEGVHGEGLLLEPKARPAAYVIALPDADQTPEQLAGGLGGSLAQSGCVVIIPTMISREARWSGRADIRFTDLPHREWIYRQAFQMGHHIIGYEVQKVRAAVGWIKARDPNARIGVAGYAEGGLIAFYSAASETRIDAALVSGYFDSRQKVWSEPIYRNVWGLLDEFGDAEIATLIAPRTLVIEYSRPPEIKSTKGDIVAPAFASVQAEFDRIGRLVPAAFQPRSLVHGGEGLSPFLRGLGVRSQAPAAPSSNPRPNFDPGPRQMRQVKELENHVQMVVRESERTRNQFFLYKVAPQLADETWSTKRRHDTIDPAPFIVAAKWYREYFAEEVIGRIHEPLLPPSPRTRRVYDNEKWTGYEVLLDVWDDVFAWGILLVPKDIRPGERRPVVVCQHGRNGLPQVTIEGEGPYNQFAARLADRGFVVFSPHNLYRGEDRYRWLSRKANGVKASLFSFIVGQHDQILRWLDTVPFVDGSRIGFYGLSYGGETAVRLPAILGKYALSICSGDFNQWTRKVASTDERFSFMYTIEWEMPYFNMGNTFDYAEMAYLILPRPFMVERGHNDRVGRDQWVDYEYAKVRWLYAQFGIAGQTEIEHFNGGHAINGEGTFRFLEKHLRQ
jgi:dienelactone hydrolase